MDPTTQINSDLIAQISWGFIVAQILFYLWQAIWLYLINKKLWEAHAWLAFVPIVNIYSFVVAWWKKPIWILWLILWIFLLLIPWLIIAIIICAGISKRTWWWFFRTLWIIFLPFIVLPIIWLTMKDKSQNNNSTTWNNYFESNSNPE